MKTAGRERSLMTTKEEDVNAHLEGDNNPNTMSRNTLIGIGLLAVVAAVMLLWPILGRPPYAYYMPLKWVVATASGASAWAVFVLNRAFLPLTVLLIASGAVELLSKMRRADWFTFNVASIVFLVIASVVILRTAMHQSDLDGKSVEGSQM